MDDWKTEIVIGVLIQQRIEELDRLRIWTRFLPEVAASQHRLDSTEKKLGYPLDPQYRDFLGYADGWRCFWQYVDLFGTEILLGAAAMDAARSQLAAVTHEDLVAAIGMTHDEVLPIAASATQPDVFLIAQPWSPSPGAVFWYAGEEIDRYRSFDEFYLAMLDYNRKEVMRLERKTSPEVS